MLVTLMNTYYYYPEVFDVWHTKFESLKPKLEENWSQYGYPSKLIHDGGISRMLIRGGEQGLC